MKRRLRSAARIHLSASNTPLSRLPPETEGGRSAWRSEPFVKEQIQAIRTPQDWARVARVLDRRCGSEADKARIALRTAGA